MEGVMTRIRFDRLASAVAMVVLVSVFLLVPAGTAAADNHVTGKLVGIDHKANKITISVAAGHETFHVSPEAEVTGPKGGNSGKHLNDPRLVPGAEVKLTLGKGNKTVVKIHIEK
jgi:hypothetical protein